MIDRAQYRTMTIKTVFEKIGQYNIRYLEAESSEKIIILLHDLIDQNAMLMSKFEIVQQSNQRTPLHQLRQS